MIKVIKAIFLYIENLWLGTNKKPSIRRVLALCFSIDFISNTSFAIKRWEAGKSYSDVAMLLGIEAALIAALLSLTTYSSLVKSKLSSSQDNTSTQNIDI